MTSITVRPKTSAGASETKSSLDVVEAPPRPQREQGNVSNYFANYFKVTVTSKIVRIYDITVKLNGAASDHGGPTGYKRRFLVKKALEKLASADTYVSDLKDVLVSIHEIDDTKLSCEISDENVPSKTYTISLSIKKRIDIEAAAQLLERVYTNWENSLCNAHNPVGDYQGPLWFLEILGIILSYQSRIDIGLTTVGRSRFFDTRGEEDSWERFLNESDQILKIIRGFSHSVRPGDSYFLLNVNSCYGVFYPNIKVSELIRGSPLLKTLEKGNVSERRLHSRLVGAQIEYNIAGKSIFKTIEGIGQPPQQQFFILREEEDKNGKTKVMHGKLASEFKRNSGSNNEWRISVYQYFDLRYGIKLDQSLPTIHIGKQCYVGAEQCTIRRWQVYKGDIGQDVSSMIQSTARKPQESLEWIKKAPKYFRFGNSKLMESFAVTVSEGLVTVKGRELQIPTIRYNNQIKFVPKLGGWDLSDPDTRLLSAGKAIHSGQHPLTCYFININNDIRQHEFRQMEGAVEALLDQMKNDAGSQLLGVDSETGSPKVNFKTIEGPLPSVLDKARKEFKDKSPKYMPKFCLIILPSMRSNANKVYSLFKRLGDVEYGFHTVCLTKSNLLMTGRGKMMTLRANLALKFNIKAKGLNHQVSKVTPKGNLASLIDSATMIAGYDVIHPTGGSQPQEKRSDKDDNSPPSFVGLVASVSQDLNQWPAIAWENPSRQEVLRPHELSDKFGSRLDIWREKHQGNLPTRIIIYRDGVSEGQYNEVLQTEVTAIQHACHTKAKNLNQKSPKILFIIATKRHRTRFYRKLDKEDATNPPNGLVVDNGVTVSRHWDFFLQPHTTRPGTTARPVHYVVLYDEFWRKERSTGTGPATKLADNAATELQQLTHDLCYSFARATKAVSVCPPVFYADLVCTRAKLHWQEYQNQSALSQGSGKSTKPSYDPLKIHANCDDSMYYI